MEKILDDCCHLDLHFFSAIPSNAIQGKTESACMNMHNLQRRSRPSIARQHRSETNSINKLLPA